ncbi:MAG: T9SS type A sorting domain-containing protein [Saprospiraceae bacterium]
MKKISYILLFLAVCFCGLAVQAKSVGDPVITPGHPQHSASGGDTFSRWVLGEPGAPPAPPPTSVCINEIDSDTPGTDVAEFIELSGTPNGALDHFVVVLFNGANDLSYRVYDLDGFSLDANGFFLIGNSGVAGVDLVIPNAILQNGADAVAIYDTASFVILSFTTTINLVDAIVYDTDDADDTGLLNGLGQSVQYNENENGLVETQSVSRSTDCGSSIVTQNPTPDASNGSSGLVLSTTQVNVLCNGNASGSIDLTVTGGVSPYTYAWTGGATTQDLSALLAGTYTVTVTDASAATATTSVTITQPTAITLTETHVNVLCNGASSGSIDLTVSGGTGAYTYSWTGGATTQDRSGLAAGTYTVTVTDANACTKTLSATITQPTALLLTETHVNVLCNGGSTGSIDLTVSGGTGAYTYSWTGGATTQDRSGLAAGTYTVTVTDANACTKTLSTTITQPAIIVLTETHVNVLCNGASNGSIDLTVTGGTGAYTYSWTGGATTQDRSGLAPGTYTVTVTDVNACTKTLSTAITEPLAITLTETHINTSCGASDGSIDLSVTGGTGAYTYSWTGGATTQDRSGLGAGTYTVTVTDANACTKTLSTTITQPGSTTLTETHTNMSCNGGSNGSIDLTVTGGTNPYTYSWTGGATTQDRSGLAAGTYTVTVTDANTCTNTLSVTLTQPTAIELTETHVNVLCNGGSSGSIDLTVSGGTGAYTYSWTSGATTQDRSGLSAGTYTVTVTDANACTKTLSTTITEPSAIVLTETHVNVLCNGASTGSIDLTPSGGTSPYTYSWTGGATTQDRAGLAAGTYTVTVTDANACTKTLSTTITEPSAIVLTETHVNVLCNGASTGSIDLTPSGGTSPYTYSWTGGATTQDRSGLSAGTYTVTVTDANACTKTLSATITEASAIVLTETHVNVLCNGSSTGSIDLTVSGGVSPYTYSWTGGATTQDRSGLSAGTYTVTVTDANACTKTLSTTITEPSAIVLTETHVNVLCSGASTGSIDLTPSGGTSPYTYSWTGGVTTQDRSGLAAGIYTVTVTDANGCTKTISATITQPTALALSSTVIHPTNCFVANGSIDLTPSGGTPGYSYDWSNDGPDVPDNDPQDLLNMVEGTYTVTVTDANGCTATHFRTLDYIDIIPPMITCPGNQNIPANATCSGTVGSWTPISVSDNCTSSGSIIVTQTPPPSTVLSGHNDSELVILTANDGNGNTSSCSFTVTLKDVTLPVAKCKNVTANLGINGTVTVAASAVNNGSTDNCGFFLTLTPNTFNCSQIGMHTVTLRATDLGGNTATCTAKVTVKDGTGPAAKCKNPTIFLNSAGQATLTTAQVNNGSTDNCGIGTMSIDKTSFNCSEISGSNPVILSLTDVNGNSSSCLSFVTVKDAIAPTPVCEDVTVELGSNGTVTVYGADLASNSTDNCSVWSYSPVAKVYTSANLGNNNLTITVKDFSGNAATCVSVVTVETHDSPQQTPSEDSNSDRNNEESINYPFIIYPNPTTGDISIAFELPSEQIVLIRLFDLQGRMVLSHEALGISGENTLPLRLEGFASGLYLLDFQSEALKVRKRLVVQE